MFAAKFFSLQPALRFDLPKLTGFPKLADLEKLAQQGLAQAHKTGQELAPVWREASGRALEQVSRTSLLVTRLVETQALPLVRRRWGPPNGAIASRLTANPTPLAAPAIRAKAGRRVGKLLTTRLVFQLLWLAITDKAREMARPAAPKPKSPWLISRKDDLIYMVGSSAVSYFFMALIFIFKVKPSTVFWIYVLFFDGPHIFGTFSRTYADPEEWQKRRKLFLGSLLWFLPGPVAVRLGLGQYFDIFAYTWAYYHLVKQHYGFSILYKKKNNDLAKLDNYLDKALIWTGFSLPYVKFLFGPNYPTGYKNVSMLLPAWTPKLASAAFFSTLTAYLARQVYKLATHQPFNAPKQLLLAASISMHMVTFRLPFAKLGGGLASLAPIVAILTVYHNIQYTRLIWFHNQNKYVKGAKTGQNFGWASTFSKNGKRYALLAFLFGAAYRVPLNNLSQGKWGASRQMAQYIGAGGWGFAFVHYYLDSKIWRVRHDARLTSALKVGSSQ